MRNQTTYLTKFSKKEREGDGQRRRRKKRKKKQKMKKKKKGEAEEEEAVASRHHPYFVIVFFLFSFFFFFWVQIQWKVGNREKWSDHGSQNREVRPQFARVPAFSHRTVLEAKKIAKINSLRFF